VQSNAYIITVARAALKIVAGASITTSALLALQLVWIVLKTPRLPPPPLSGVDFVREGRVVRADDDETNDDVEDFQNGGAKAGMTSTKILNKGAEASSCNKRTNTNAIRKQKEFRLVLVGDSPVEGIGNIHHKHALGGQTARAFANLVCHQEEYDCVRYWSYGKSGLTARGINEELVPLVHRVVDDVHQSATNHNDDGDGTDKEASSDPAIHAIILLCGVNNVLDPLSTRTSFHSEVHSLLEAIRVRPELEHTPLIVLGLPDFANLPFLPWPLGFALGLRGRKMQRILEMVVTEFQLKEKGKLLDNNQPERAKTIMVNIPEVQEVLRSIGYHRHDSTDKCITNDGSSDAHINSSMACPLRMKLCHPLLKYLGDGSQSKIGSLGMEDFLCDDGFHPGKYGTVYIGNLIAEAYGKMMRGALVERDSILHQQ